MMRWLKDKKRDKRSCSSSVGGYEQEGEEDDYGFEKEKPASKSPKNRRQLPPTPLTPEEKSPHIYEEIHDLQVGGGAGAARDPSSSLSSSTCPSSSSSLPASENGKGSPQKHKKHKHGVVLGNTNNNIGNNSSATTSAVPPGNLSAKKSKEGGDNNNLSLPKDDSINPYMVVPVDEEARQTPPNFHRNGTPEVHCDVIIKDTHCEILLSRKPKVSAFRLDSTLVTTTTTTTASASAVASPTTAGVESNGGGSGYPVIRNNTHFCSRNRRASVDVHSAGGRSACSSSGAWNSSTFSCSSTSRVNSVGNSVMSLSALSERVPVLDEGTGSDSSAKGVLTYNVGGNFIPRATKLAYNPLKPLDVDNTSLSNQDPFFSMMPPPPSSSSSADSLHLKKMAGISVLPQIVSNPNPAPQQLYLPPQPAHCDSPVVYSSIPDTDNMAHNPSHVISMPQNSRQQLLIDNNSTGVSGVMGSCNLAPAFLPDTPTHPFSIRAASPSNSSSCTYASVSFPVEPKVYNTIAPDLISQETTEQLQSHTVHSHLESSAELESETESIRYSSIQDNTFPNLNDIGVLGAMSNRVDDSVYSGVIPYRANATPQSTGYCENHRGDIINVTNKPVFSNESCFSERMVNSIVYSGVSDSQDNGANNMMTLYASITDQSHLIDHDVENMGAAQSHNHTETNEADVDRILYGQTVNNINNSNNNNSNDAIDINNDTDVNDNNDDNNNDNNNDFMLEFCTCVEDQHNNTVCGFLDGKVADDDTSSIATTINEPRGPCDGCGRLIRQITYSESYSDETYEHVYSSRLLLRRGRRFSSPDITLSEISNGETGRTGLECSGTAKNGMRTNGELFLSRDDLWTARTSDVTSTFYSSMDSEKKGEAVSANDDELFSNDEKLTRNDAAVDDNDDDDNRNKNINRQWSCPVEPRFNEKSRKSFSAFSSRSNAKNRTQNMAPPSSVAHCLAFHRASLPASIPSNLIPVSSSSSILQQPNKPSTTTSAFSSLFAKFSRPKSNKQTPKICDTSTTNNSLVVQPAEVMVSKQQCQTLRHEKAGDGNLSPHTNSDTARSGNTIPERNTSKLSKFFQRLATTTDHDSGAEMAQRSKDKKREDDVTVKGSGLGPSMALGEGVDTTTSGPKLPCASMTFDPSVSHVKVADCHSNNTVINNNNNINNTDNENNDDDNDNFKDQNVTLSVAAQSVISISSKNCKNIISPKTEVSVTECGGGGGSGSGGGARSEAIMPPPYDKSRYSTTTTTRSSVSTLVMNEIALDKLASEGASANLQQLQPDEKTQTQAGPGPGVKPQNKTDSGDTCYEYDISTSSESEPTSYDNFLSGVKKSLNLEEEVQQMAGVDALHRKMYCKKCKRNDHYQQHLQQTSATNSESDYLFGSDFGCPHGKFGDLRKIFGDFVVDQRAAILDCLTDYAQGPFTIKGEGRDSLCRECGCEIMTSDSESMTTVYSLLSQQFCLGAGTGMHTPSCDSDEGTMADNSCESADDEEDNDVSSGYDEAMVPDSYHKTKKKEKSREKKDRKQSQQSTSPNNINNNNNDNNNSNMYEKDNIMTERSKKRAHSSYHCRKSDSSNIDQSSHYLPNYEKRDFGCQEDKTAMTSSVENASTTNRPKSSSSAFRKSPGNKDDVAMKDGPSAKMFAHSVNNKDQISTTGKLEGAYGCKLGLPRARLLANDRVIQDIYAPLPSKALSWLTARNPCESRISGLPCSCPRSPYSSSVELIAEDESGLTNKEDCTPAAVCTNNTMMILNSNRKTCGKSVVVSNYIGGAGGESGGGGGVGNSGGGSTDVGLSVNVNGLCVNLNSGSSVPARCPDYTIHAKDQIAPTLSQSTISASTLTPAGKNDKDTSSPSKTVGHLLPSGGQAIAHATVEKEGEQELDFNSNNSIPTPLSDHTPGRRNIFSCSDALSKLATDNLNSDDQGKLHSLNHPNFEKNLNCCIGVTSNVQALKTQGLSGVQVQLSATVLEGKECYADKGSKPERKAGSSKHSSSVPDTDSMYGHSIKMSSRLTQKQMQMAALDLLPETALGSDDTDTSAASDQSQQPQTPSQPEMTQKTHRVRASKVGRLARMFEDSGNNSGAVVQQGDKRDSCNTNTKLDGVYSAKKDPDRSTTTTTGTYNGSCGRIRANSTTNPILSHIDRIDTNDNNNNNTIDNTNDNVLLSGTGSSTIVTCNQSHSHSRMVHAPLTPKYIISSDLKGVISGVIHVANANKDDPGVNKFIEGNSNSNCNVKPALAPTTPITSSTSSSNGGGSGASSSFTAAPVGSPSRVKVAGHPNTAATAVTFEPGQKPGTFSPDGSFVARVALPPCPTDHPVSPPALAPAPTPASFYHEQSQTDKGPGERGKPPDLNINAIETSFKLSGLLLKSLSPSSPSSGLWLPESVEGGDVGTPKPGKRKETMNLLPRSDTCNSRTNCGSQRREGIVVNSGADAKTAYSTTTTTTSKDQSRKVNMREGERESKTRKHVMQNVSPSLSSSSGSSNRRHQSSGQPKQKKLSKKSQLHRRARSRSKSERRRSHPHHQQGGSTSRGKEERERTRYYFSSDLSDIDVIEVEDWETYSSAAMTKDKLKLQSSSSTSSGKNSGTNRHDLVNIMEVRKFTKDNNTTNNNNNSSNSRAVRSCRKSAGRRSLAKSGEEEEEGLVQEVYSIPPSSSEIRDAAVAGHRKEKSSSHPAGSPAQAQASPEISRANSTNPLTNKAKEKKTDIYKTKLNNNKLLCDLIIRNYDRKMYEMNSSDV